MLSLSNVKNMVVVCRWPKGLRWSCTGFVGVFLPVRVFRVVKYIIVPLRVIYGRLNATKKRTTYPHRPMAGFFFCVRQAVVSMICYVYGMCPLFVFCLLERGVCYATL